MSQVIVPPKKKVNQLYHKLVIAYAAPKAKADSRVVNYYCPGCRRGIKTVLIDEGVTPHFFVCDKCGKPAEVTNLFIGNMGEQPIYEWFRPTLDECMKMRRTNPPLLAYILRGGLHYRKIGTKPTDPK